MNDPRWQLINSGDTTFWQLDTNGLSFFIDEFDDGFKVLVENRDDDYSVTCRTLSGAKNWVERIARIIGH